MPFVCRGPGYRCPEWFQWCVRRRRTTGEGRNTRHRFEPGLGRRERLELSRISRKKLSARNVCRYIDKDTGEEYLDVSLGVGRFLNQFDLSTHVAPIGLKVGAGIETEHREGVEYGLNAEESRNEILSARDLAWMSAIHPRAVWSCPWISSTRRRFAACPRLISGDWGCILR